MEAAYDPQQVEAQWYDRWETAGVFRPEHNPDGDPFTIVIPPPNVTGQLHMGHALDLAIQDLLIRRKRMQGYAALWVPGTDHAGIATQNVVERELAAEGKTRHDLGREAFVERVWDWKARLGGRITEQIRRLGYSCDWSRERFTMDEGLSAAVRHVFVRLYDEDLIYRGYRIINWCPRCHTALSDIEVEHEEEMGELARLRYPFTDGDGGVEVATTRAETMLGDTAVAVHPDDERYKDLVGRMLTLPLVGRDIPIVADDSVDPDFGTGAVKVTPAHDPNDFEIGQRHGLESVTMLDEHAAVTAAGGQFEGMDRYEAREAVKSALAEQGFLVGVDEHPHSVGHCYRCKTVIEPYLSDQWFVKVGPLVEPAIEAVRSGEMRFVPSRWANNYYHWMENLRDWTISRQIWWGHRIPAWTCAACEQVIVAIDDPTECACGSTDLAQDPDVLDTWFSSALWPFSTLGWPEQTADLERHYPNSVMVTGYDIIYFWVARMIKMGIHFMEGIPYPDVVIHGLIRAEDGRKMSKSLGNATDPLELVAEYGADALRLALIQSASPGQDVPYKVETVDAARRFGNKLWNAVRFSIPYLDDVPASGGYPEDPTPENRWILSRWNEVLTQFDAMLDDYRFSDAYGVLYSFAWSEVFDWYLELAKTPLRGDDAAETSVTLGVIMRDLLKAFHPVIPYLTEELWHEVVGDSLLAGDTWPEPPAYDPPEGFETFRELVVGIRRFRAEHGLAPRHPLDVTLLNESGKTAEWWGPQFEALAFVTPHTVDAVPAGEGFTRVVAGDVQALISMEGAVDVAAEKERIQKSIDETAVLLAGSEKKLSNTQFIDRAPDEVVAKERGKAAEFVERLAKLQTQLEDLG
jgi:valyl-tRNA synthetase